MVLCITNDVELVISLTSIQDMFISLFLNNIMLTWLFWPTWEMYVGFKLVCE